MAEHAVNPRIEIPMSIQQVDPNLEVMPKSYPKVGPGPQHQPDMLTGVDQNVVIQGK